MSTTHPVMATPEWIARDICAMAHAAKTPEERIGVVQILTGYLDRIPRTPVESAAPDLLAALVEMRDVAQVPEPHSNDEIRRLYRATLAADAAIAKAEGGAA